MLRDCKERAGADRPVVSANIILMKHTLDDVPELLTKLKELGVSSAQFVDLCTYPEYEGPLTLRDGTDLRQQQLAAVMSEEEIWDKLNEFKSYGDDDFIVTIPGEWGGLKIAKDTSRTVFTCFELWKMPFLKPDGVLSTCCWAPQFEMGDFKEQTFEEIWFGDAYHDMRMSHLTNSHPQHCLECQELMRVVVSKDRSELRRQGAQPYEEVFLHK
jgi:radical SAM protein with 4Fe4S-binding SPASM domain